MKLPMLGYENIQITPFKLQELLELKVVRKINEHTRLSFTGIVPEDQKDSYVLSVEAKTQIEVNLTGADGSAKPFFKGPVTRVQVKAVRDIYYLQVEAVSYTYDLDIKVKSRSFQNSGLTYTDLIKRVLADYPGADFHDTATKGVQLGGFAIQYQETDWNFLKRVASQFHACLIAADFFDRPKLYFGIPEGDLKGELDNYRYSVRKNFKDYRSSCQNYNSSLQESDFIYYEVETGEILNLGDQVKFQGRLLYVCEAVSVMEDSLLKHIYLLAPQGGLSQKPLYNQALAGASIQGKVLAVAKDKIRVHLEIDREQKPEEAYWFPYASIYTAEGHSGWYCMPEVGDYVRVYFPDHDLANAVAVSSVRQDTKESENNKVSNPDIKYFRTKSGKELMFSPNEIVITGKDGEIFIRLHDREGIEIHSKTGIRLSTASDLMLESAAKVIISAQQEIAMECQDSKVQLDGSTTIKGYEIKAN